MTDSAPSIPGAQEGITGNFVDWLGLEFVEMSGDEVVCTWSAEPRMHQPYGIVHGGIHCSVVETLASFGAATWLGEKGQVVGVNNNTDFLRAITAGMVTAVSTPIHRGRRQQIWLIEITDTNDKLVARGQVRLQNLPNEA